MKVILLGYMGSGKSTIGKRLAHKRNSKFIDLDTYITNKEQTTINDIFKHKGEIYFRKIETMYLEELVNSEDNLVLSLGGGTPCYGKNMNIIKNASDYSFYLKGSIDTLYKRLSKAKTKRPLIANLQPEALKEYIAKHLFERRTFYEQANFKIAINDQTVEEIVTAINSNIP